MKRYSTLFCSLSVACAALVLANIPYVWAPLGSKWVGWAEGVIMLCGLATGLLALLWGKNTVVRLVGLVGLAVTARYAFIPLALLVSSLFGAKD